MAKTSKKVSQKRGSKFAVRNTLDAKDVEDLTEY